MVPPIPQVAPGTAPLDELGQWRAWRAAVDASEGGAAQQMTPEQAKYYNGPSPRPNDPRFDNPQFSKEATQTYVNKDTHFDIPTGKVVKNQSGWDLPETKLIVALAAGAAAGFAAPAIAGSLGGSSAAGGAGAATIPTTAGIESATALGLPVTAGLGSAGTAAAAGAAAIPTTAGLTGAEFGGEAATQALPALADTSGLVAGGSGAFDAAGSWVPSGTSAPVSAGSKFAQITDAIKQGKDLAGSFSNAGVGPDGNAAHAPQSSADAARAQALTNNRFLQTSKDQAGVATDTNVMRNQMRAALIARMTPGGFTTPGYRLNSGGTIAQPDLSATQSAIDFNKTYADKLRERQLAGQPMTLSGVPEASQEEKDATARALNNSGTGTGLNSDITRVGNAIDTGTRYADLGQNAYTKGKSIWNVVKGFF